MTRLLRWVGLVVVAVGALIVFLLGATYFGLPWWRFGLRTVTYQSDVSVELWTVALGLGWSPFIVRDRARWFVSVRVVAATYAATGLAGALCWLLLLGPYLQPYLWGEFTQLTVAAAPLWITAAIAIVISTFAQLDRRVASSLIVVTFWALVLALEAVWAPYVIPYLSHLT